jgi:hypothetical protein
MGLDDFADFASDIGDFAQEALDVASETLSDGFEFLSDAVPSRPYFASSFFRPASWISLDARA